MILWVFILRRTIIRLTPAETTEQEEEFLCLSQMFIISSQERIWVLSSIRPLWKLFIDIALGNKKNIIVGCIYRPPDSDINTFNDALYSTLEIINKENKLCALLGDFNINLLKEDLVSTSLSEHTLLCSFLSFNYKAISYY